SGRGPASPDQMGHGAWRAPAGLRRRGSRSHARLAASPEMIAIDTNLLVYAHRSATPEHRAARRAIERAAAHQRSWGIAAASVSEFWAVVTHSTARGRPSGPAEASRFLRALIESGGMAIWRPGEAFGERFVQLAEDLDVPGARIYDLQIGLTALDNGAFELWTHDQDFVRIPGLSCAILSRSWRPGQGGSERPCRSPVVRTGTTRKSMVIHYSVRGADRAKEVRGPVRW